MEFFADKIEQFKDKTALIESNGDKVTYADIVKTSDEFKAKTEGRALAFVLCTNTIGSIVGYLSFMRNRIVPTMLDAKIDAGLLSDLVNEYRPQYIYMPADHDMIEGYDDTADFYGYKLTTRREKSGYELYPDLALLLTTSGSTGSPKFVRQSYANIQANTESIDEYLHIDENEKPITTLPMYYTYGLSVIQSHVNRGATILVTEDTVVNAAFWKFFKQEGATSIAGVPYTYEMLKKLRFMRMDLPTLKTMTQAGGKLPYDLHKEFGEYALSKGINMVVMYGQCEATARMAYLAPDKVIEKCGSIGVAIPGGRFEIRDVDGNPITEPEKDGELVYHGPNVTLGYALKAEDLAKGDERGGALQTGDVAKFDKDGFYYITGRLKRFLKIYGSRVNLDEIDQLIIKQFPGIECASTGTDNHLITYITDESLVDQVRDFIPEKTHINRAAVEVRHIDEIPRNGSGKITYKSLPKE